MSSFPLSDGQKTACRRSVPDSSAFFLALTGHIESASFQSNSDNLYCRYTFSFGQDWEIVHGIHSGLSQIARRRQVCATSTIVWNFPLDVVFKSTNVYGWPRLAISVYGLDTFGRDVVRGYTSLLCPTSPGRYVKYVRTYIPVSPSVCQELINWVAGTMPEFYNSKFVTQGEGRAVTRVKSGGTIKVVLNITAKNLESFGYIVQPTEASWPESRLCST